MNYNVLLRIQIKQGKEELSFLSKYTEALLNRFDIDNTKTYSMPMGTSIKLDKCEMMKDR